MEQFATEEQQVEAIKRFWKEHGTAIIVGAALGLAFGPGAYSEAQIEKKRHRLPAKCRRNIRYRRATQKLKLLSKRIRQWLSIASLLAAKQAVMPVI